MQRGAHEIDLDKGLVTGLGEGGGEGGLLLGAGWGKIGWRMLYRGVWWIFEGVEGMRGMKNGLEVVQDEEMGFF